MQNKDKLMRALLRYSNDREAVADAVQNAFLEALQNRDVISYFVMEYS